ncbi:MoxR family ATPase [Candidatus Woesearchaeota archaeon]|nr:MoxR family ATPase [Candidatus Woesearchaeota archaeon]
MDRERLKAVLLKASLDDILGQEPAKQQLKSALLMGRHVILIGPPGIGKTTLVKNLASYLPEREGKQRFVRVQGSPDLTAEDLIGDIDPVKALEHGPLSPEAFTPGKIFKADGGILFFDEVNRCSEKLQNALLQALEEHKVTIGSYDVDFEADFILIGTMNPEDNSTEPLSDVFLDRFDLVAMGYPESQRVEEDIVESKAQRLVTVPEDLKQLIVTYVRSLREDDQLEKLPSVRATIGLYERAQSNAYLSGRSVVQVEDLGPAVDSVIAHRIRLKPSAQFLTTPEQHARHAYEELLQDRLKAIGGGR